MKVLKLLFAVLVLLVSCSKDNPGITNPPPATDTLGAGWTKVTIPNASFSDIIFIDNNTGFAVGDQGLHKSVDGGKTWQLTSTRFSGNGYLAATADGKVFVTLEHIDTLYRSFDGGITFSALKMNAPMPITDLYLSIMIQAMCLPEKMHCSELQMAGITGKLWAPLPASTLAREILFPFSSMALQGG